MTKAPNARPAVRRRGCCSPSRPSPFVGTHSHWNAPRQGRFPGAAMERLASSSPILARFLYRQPGALARVHETRITPTDQTAPPPARRAPPPAQSRDMRHLPRHHRVVRHLARPSAATPCEPKIAAPAATHSHRAPYFASPVALHVSSADARANAEACHAFTRGIAI